MHTASPTGKKNLILALRKIGDVEAVPLLGHMAQFEPNADVRREAEWTLKSWAADGAAKAAGASGRRRRCARSRKRAAPRRPGAFGCRRSRCSRSPRCRSAATTARTSCSPPVFDLSMPRMDDLAMTRDLAITSAGVVTVGAGGGNAFTPATVTIAAGQSVTWNWVSGFHSVISDSVAEGVRRCAADRRRGNSR